MINESYNKSDLSELSKDDSDNSDYSDNSDNSTGVNLLFNNCGGEGIIQHYLNFFGIQNG